MTARKALLLLPGILLVTSGMSAQANVPRLTALTEGGDGPPTIVLLHGYCSSASDWTPFATTLQLPPGARFIFPRGLEAAKRSDGGPAGRAWWHLDLSPSTHRGSLGADLSAKRPAGIVYAAKAVRALLARRGNQAQQPFVLGGFSQGAMVAAQVAFLSDEPLGALVLLSGTLVNEASWKAHYARRKGLRVFISHGHADPVLSFAVADRMQREMTAAGLLVTWFPFEGGHETPAEVVTAMNEFLAHLW